MKKRGYLILGAFCIICWSAVCVLCTYQIVSSFRQKHNFDVVIKEVSEQPSKYQFLDKDLSDYICALCIELELDSDEVVARLMVENPEFNYEVMHRNENGTIDCGLWQLNDKYLWTTFKKNYWFEDVELDPFNWKHNTYIALHHMKYLQDKFKIKDEAIMAYNCGEGAVMNNNIPASTYVYLAKVKNNLWLLKNREDNNGQTGI